MIEWTVSPVPERKLVISRLFQALRNRNLAALEEQWMYAESWNSHLKGLSVDRATKSSFLLDGNAEEDPDYRMTDDLVKRTPKTSEDITDSSSIRGNSISERPGKFCLLHVAVDYLFLDGVKFLLEKGAEVRRRLECVLFLLSCCSFDSNRSV